MNWPNDVKIALVVLLAFGIAFVVSRQPEEARQEFVMSTVASPYDLNGDGFISEADAVIYAEVLHQLDFNGDGQIDIFDQVMLAGEIRPTVKVCLPVILKEYRNDTKRY